MTVIELPSENGDKPDLWIHSPVALDKPLIEALESIGNVKHVVSPNYEHVKYALEWQKYFIFKGKQVNMWASPGLSEKVPEVDWTGELPFGCRFSDNQSEITRAKYPTEMWDLDELQVLHIDCESGNNRKNTQCLSGFLDTHNAIYFCLQYFFFFLKFQF